MVDESGRLGIGGVSGGAVSLEDRRRARDLRRMKLVSGGMLVVATIVYLLARSQEHRGGAWGYVRAAAEASMVGGIADWFAVTALFRHPFGIPIPHTAIIRKRKDDIGRGLGTFVSELFLTEEAVTERLLEAKVSARAGTWLAQPANAETAARQLLLLVGNVVETVREDEIRAAIEQAVENKVRATPAGPIVGRALELAVAEGRHQQVLGVVLRKVADVLVESKPALRERMYTESPWWVPESVDDRVFNRLFDAVMRFIFDVANNDRHELRRQVDSRVEVLARDLQNDPALQQRADELKEELLSHPELRRWSGAIWGDVKDRVKQRALDPDADTVAKVATSIRQFGERLATDTELADSLDHRLAHLVGSAVEGSKGEVGNFIATTVQRWDSQEASERIELQVGRDLQFIRINGTIVGGLAGLLIYTLSNLSV